jgi:hypothetical protein
MPTSRRPSGIREGRRFKGRIKVTSVNNDSEWQKLHWKEKIQICQQRIGQEDSLMIAYVVIFIGLETVFTTIFLSRILPCCFNVAVASLGVLMAIIFMLVCKRRGDMVDRWSVVFYSLWQKVPDDEVIATSKTYKDKNLVVKAKDIGEDYKGCVERLKGSWKGWKPIFFGWGRVSDRMCFWLTSWHRLVTVFAPILIILMWVLLLYRILDS